MDYEAPPMPCGCILLLLVFSYSVVSDSFETPWPAGHQAPLSMGFPRQEYWSGLPFPTAGTFLTQGSNSSLLGLGRQVLYHCTTWEDSLPLHQSEYASDSFPL